MESLSWSAPQRGATAVSASIIDLTGKSPSDVARAVKEIPKGVMVKVDIHRIVPSHVNDKVYRPVRPDDPGIQSLAEDIKANGLLVPIVITRDFMILSGHRRHAACRLAGLKEVICRFEDISSGDRRFLPLLVAYNNQRVKSIDEVLREQVIASADPKRAHEALRNHRAVQSYVEAEFLDIGARRVRSKISQGKMEMLHAIIDIVDALRKYWPISERRVHYGLLNDPPLRHTNKPDSRYQNNPQCYKDTTDMVTRGRLEGHIPFSAISDPTRTVCNWNVHKQTGTFIKRELEDFLRGYWRDLMQSQPNHIEIIGEKNTIESSIKHVAAKYTIPYTLGRGYCSLDPIYRMTQRFKASGKDKLITLVMSDFDPEGEDIPRSFAKTLRDDFGIRDVLALKVGLTLEQVEEYGLPPNNILDEKENGARIRAFQEKYGEDQSAHELEALPEEDRAAMLEAAILSVIDIDAYNHELAREEEDAARLEEVRSRLIKSLADELGEERDEDPEENDEQFPD